MGNKKYEWESRLEDAVANSLCRSDVLRYLGLPLKGSYYHYRVQQRIDQLSLDTSHFDLRKVAGRASTKIEEISNDDLFVRNSLYSRRGVVRRRLLRDSLIPYVCGDCGNNGTHNGKELALQLDHINGIHSDNRLENLRWLCPNCHSQTETWGGRRKRKPRERKERVSKKGIARPEIRKVEWPSMGELKQRIDMGQTWRYIASEYGVSDNAVRKWAKRYGLLPL